MTLLPDGPALVIDGAEDTQALLVRAYLDRLRRRPATRRTAHLPLLLPPNGAVDTLRPRPPVGTNPDDPPPGSGLPASLTRRPLTGSLLVRLLGPPEADRMPTTVRMAIDFLEERAAEPIGLTEIADAAGLSPRALQAAFRRHLGTSPLGHLRAVRLARVHADLHSARPGDGQTVSAVANRWGFSQLSRFARDYQRRYGVTPRQTLGRTAP